MPAGNIFQCSLEVQSELITNTNVNWQWQLVQYSSHLQGLIGNIPSFYRKKVFMDFFVPIHRTRRHKEAFSVNSDGNT